jgi:hypothetical protein
MPYLARLGRPPISTGCVDCTREGLPPDQVQPKRFGSYCGPHMYARQKKNKITTSARKAVVHGDWDGIPELASEKLIEQCGQNIDRILKRMAKKSRGHSIAFEYECMRMALQVRRRITLAEEDEAIKTWGGSRSGYDPFEPKLLGPNYFANGAVDDRDQGPWLLPNPKIRAAHRYELQGGPTTEDEPSFTQYYYDKYETKPPKEYLEEDVVLYVVHDGVEMRADMVEQWDKDRAAGRPLDLSDLPDEVREQFVNQGSEGENRNQSISQMMAGEE